MAATSEYDGKAVSVDADATTARRLARSSPVAGPEVAAASVKTAPRPAKTAARGGDRAQVAGEGAKLVAQYMGRPARVGHRGASPKPSVARQGPGAPTPPRRGGPLGTTRITLPKITGPDPEQAAKAVAAAARRRARYELRGRLWDVTGVERCKGCGRVSVAQDGTVGLRVAEGMDGDSRKAGFSGLATCGSVWCCPVCASKIAAKRAEDLIGVLGWAVDQGHTAGMLTLTARHHQGQSLAGVWDAVSGAWSAITAGAAWAGESMEAHEKATIDWQERWAQYETKLLIAEAAIARWEKASPETRGRKPRKPRRPAAEMRPRRVGIAEKWGVLGWARVVEVTRGRNGWHPHLHIMVVLEGDQPPEVVEALGRAVLKRWQKALRRKGFDASDEHGMDIRTSTDEDVMELPKYLVKSMAMEATGGHAKLGKMGGQTPFQILQMHFDTGSSEHLEAWREWERTSLGRQQMTWSRDLRDMAGLAQEQTDEEIAEESFDGEDVLTVDTPTWRKIAPVQIDLIQAAEENGLPGARAWLRGRGLGWTELDGDQLITIAPPASAEPDQDKSAAPPDAAEQARRDEAAAYRHAQAVRTQLDGTTVSMRERAMRFLVKYLPRDEEQPTLF